MQTMQSILEVIFYILTFLALYSQVFSLVIFLENYKKLKIRRGPIRLFEKDEDYPGVTITVPAYNEGENVRKTVESLLNLNYPKDKLFIILIDDGSKDNTFEIMKEYEGHPQIQMITKPNGGKYTAQNLGLELTKTPYLGCLDADSTLDPEALNRIMSYFIEDPENMAVTPTIISRSESNIVQKAQKTEYELQIYFKKMLGYVNAIHVTPGPFSIFKKEVFDKIGPYKHAHTTEDQEIALRMQSHHMKIENAPDAFIYTNTPKTVKALYKQRTRWMYGFIRNALDYKKLFFKAEYGNVGFITLPIGIIGTVSVVFILLALVYQLYDFLVKKSLTLSAVGFTLQNYRPNFNPFFFNISTMFFLMLLTYAAIMFSLYMGHKIIYGKSKFSFDVIWFFIVYSIVAPLWLLKAIINSIRNYETSWTKEIEERYKKGR